MVVELATSPVAVITGGSRGIGAGVAVWLARSGRHVVIVARDSKAARHVTRLVREASPQGLGNFLPVDLSQLGQVRALADDIAARFPSPALLLHGAATVPPRRILTPEGFETQWTVNHLAPFLLTACLENVGCGPLRTLSVASKLHRNGRVVTNDSLFVAKDYDSNQTYADTKLANVLFARALATRLEGTDRSSSCLHPGVASTGLLQDLQGAGPLDRVRTRLVRAVRKVDPWGLTESVATVSKLALAEELLPPNGSYWEDGAFIDPSDTGRDVALAEDLWSLSERTLAPWS